MNEFIFPRYIKREDAQKVICGWCGICENPTLEDLEKCDDICPQFSQIPNGDVRPVVRGKWELTSVYDIYGVNKKIGYHCPYCGWFTRSPDNFCPHCGAYMRGGEKNG